jgi:hypothetical protein
MGEDTNSFDKILASPMGEDTNSFDKILTSPMGEDTNSFDKILSSLMDYSEYQCITSTNHLFNYYLCN